MVITLLDVVLSQGLPYKFVNEKEYVKFFVPLTINHDNKMRLRPLNICVFTLTWWFTLIDPYPYKMPLNLSL